MHKLHGLRAAAFDCIHIDVWKLRPLHLATYNALGIHGCLCYQPCLDRRARHDACVRSLSAQKTKATLLHASHTTQERYRPPQWLALTRLPVISRRHLVPTPQPLHYFRQGLSELQLLHVVINIGAARESKEAMSLYRPSCSTDSNFGI